MQAPFTYPTTPHLRGSRGTAGDVFLDVETTRRVLAECSVVQEKLDGVNVGMRFAAGGVQVVLKDRSPTSHELRRLTGLTDQLADVIPQLGAMQLFGEFLPSTGAWCLFDVFDERPGRLLSHQQVRQYAEALGVSTPPVLHQGPLESLDAVRSLLHRPLHGHQRMEGVVLRVERDGWLRERYKFVRPDFVQTVHRLGPKK